MLNRGAHWRHLANTGIDLCVGDAGSRCRQCSDLFSLRMTVTELRLRPPTGSLTERARASRESYLLDFRKLKRCVNSEMLRRQAMSWCEPTAEVEAT